MGFGVTNIQIIFLRRNVSEHETIISSWYAWLCRYIPNHWWWFIFFKTKHHQLFKCFFFFVFSNFLTLENGPPATELFALPSAIIIFNRKSIDDKKKGFRSDTIYYLLCTIYPSRCLKIVSVGIYRIYTDTKLKIDLSKLKP